MNLNRYSRIKRITSFTLFVALCVCMMFADRMNLSFNRASARSFKGSEGGRERASKVSPRLRDHGHATSKRAHAETPVNVILQLDGKSTERLNTILKRNGVNVRREFKSFNSRAVELPASVIEELAELDEVSFISEDAEVQTLGHVSTTTGADAVRLQTTTTLTNTSTVTKSLPVLDGTGLGIAVLDSGIDPRHVSFTGKTGGPRIVASVDFTGEGRTDDPYGHGTHVAAIAAGNGLVGYAKYLGIAPNSNLLNLRVLNSQGKGSVSALLKALDWVMLNRTTYNIRVVNMSLGTAAIDSYKNDPLCRAVRRLVDAGVVVVAAAGNNGKDGSNNKIYGQIHSPGNEASALTVGAVNTLGTDARGDDAIASYSSRGPTRSYSTDASGVKHYDNLIKPDIVAPGNKIVSACAAGNLLVTQSPQLNAGVSADPSRNMMYMNGTSMAAPVAAGAASLLLQANPKLTPNMVKVLLMYTAQQIAGANTLEQGAGEINIEGAVRLARLVRADLSPLTLPGAPLLTTSTLPAPRSTVGGQAFTWSQGIIMDRTFATGSNLITKYQKVYATGTILNDGVMTGDGILKCNLTLMSSGVMLADQILTSNGITMSEGVNFLGTDMLGGDGVMLADGVMVSDGVMLGDGVMTGDGVMLGDSLMQALSSMINGDATLNMSVEMDDGSNYTGY